MGYWSRRFQAACRDTAAVMNLKPLALAVTAIVSIGAVIVFGRIQGETAAQSQIDWIVSVVKVALGAGVIVFLINFFLITPWHMDQASQKTIAGLNEKIVELRGSEIVEAYAELSVQRTGENTFDVALTFSRNVAAVLAGAEFPGAYRVIWSEPFASTDYLVDIDASKRPSVREERSRRTRESILIYFGLEEKAITVIAKGRRTAHA
jgi:hypothetical protein